MTTGEEYLTLSAFVSLSNKLSSSKQATLPLRTSVS